MYGLVRYSFLTEYMIIMFDAHKILFLLKTLLHNLSIPNVFCPLYATALIIKFSRYYALNA